MFSCLRCREYSLLLWLSVIERFFLKTIFPGDTKCFCDFSHNSSANCRSPFQEHCYQNKDPAYIYFFTYPSLSAHFLDLFLNLKTWKEPTSQQGLWVCGWRSDGSLHVLVHWLWHHGTGVPNLVYQMSHNAACFHEGSNCRTRHHKQKFPRSRLAVPHLLRFKNKYTF